MINAVVLIEDIDAAQVPALIVTGALEPAEVGRQLMSLPATVVAEVLTSMPVMMAAAVCRDSVGCGDEMILLENLPPEIASDVMFTDLVLFAGVDDLHAFRLLALEGVPLGKYKQEVSDRTLEVTNVRGETVRIPFALDPERVKLYVNTLLALDEECFDRLVDAMGGEETLITLCAFVVSVMVSRDYDWDDEWMEVVADRGLLVSALALSRQVDRIALEHELLDPHLESMKAHFAPTQEVFEQFEGVSTEDLLGELEL
jgi:hypothetical protein